MLEKAKAELREAREELRYAQDLAAHRKNLARSEPGIWGDTAKSTAREARAAAADVEALKGVVADLSRGRR